MRKVCGVLVGLLLPMADAGHAQRAGTVEIGAFGRYTWLDSDLNFKDNVGIGGRFGIFVLNNLAVEADASYTPTEGPNAEKINYVPMHARLVYNLPMSARSALLLGGGYTRNLFRDSYRETSNGLGGLLGLRFGDGRHFSIRFDVTGDYITNPESRSAPGSQLPGVGQADKNFHLGAQAGISLLVGRQRDGDRDRDGVKDSVDRCPETLAGDRVDATGCSLPKDGDRDGVMDNLDQCPGTPAGDRVDTRGCSLPKDADKDGVVDSADRCPATPAGVAVDANGCSLPVDGDKDGVVDSADRCPNTPAGTAVDQTGCPKDSDKDGVVDGTDRCPNTPAGATVDQFGCPPDRDGDGVADSMDRCAGTPAGTKVDRVGCTELFVADKPLVLTGVNFETNKTRLLPGSRAILDTVAFSLINNPDVRVEIGGHTDNVGTNASNQRLSQGRADAVKVYLVSKGVNGDRLTTRGYGEDSPMTENTTAAGRAANRRVELNKIN